MKGESMITYHNWRSKIENSTLRRFYESLDCARLFNTKYLLDYSGIDLKGVKGRLALSIVCRIKDDKSKCRKVLFDWMLREKCDFNLKDEEGLTLIAWLCKHNRYDFFEQLIKKSALDIDYTASDENKDGPLMHAVRAGNVDMVKQLITTYVDFGISVDVFNKDGLTPYAEAIRLKLTEIADILKNEGKASTHVYIEPIWSLKQSDLTFKDIISNNLPINEFKQKKKKELPKGPKSNPKSKIEKPDTPKTPVISINDVILQNDEISDITTSSRRISFKIKDNSLEKKGKSGIIKIEEPPRKPKKVVKKKPKKKVANNKENDSSDSKSKHVDDLTLNVESMNLSPAEKSSVAVTEQKEDQSKGKGGDDVFDSDKLMITKEKEERHAMRVIRKMKLQRRRSMAGNSRRASIIQQQQISQDTLEVRIAYEENRMQELMQYTPQVNNYSQNYITYEDVKSFFPMSNVHQSSNSNEQLCWLLRLQVEQKEMPRIRHILTRNEIRRIIPPEQRSETRAARAKTFSNDVPSMTRRRSTLLCNTVFNRLLSA